MLGRYLNGRPSASALIFQLFGKVPSMKEQLLTTVHRRNLLKLLAAGTVAGATATEAPVAVAAESLGSPDKRKARYRADSAEVQDFYRVNRYPIR
jgi:hypothetical protein